MAHGGDTSGKIIMMFSEILARIVPTAAHRQTNGGHARKDCRLLALLAGLLVGLLFSAGLPAAELTGSQLAPSQDTTPILTLQEGDRRQRLSLADIERLPLHEARLQHPEGPEGVYSGVLLADFLAAYALDDATRLRLIAVDNYSIFLKQEQLNDKTYLLVTRFDGAPIPRNQRGPLMLVVPAEEEAVREGQEPFDKWIWSLATINAS